MKNCRALMNGDVGWSRMGTGYLELFSLGGLDYINTYNTVQCMAHQCTAKPVLEIIYYGSHTNIMESFARRSLVVLLKRRYCIEHMGQDTLFDAILIKLTKCTEWKMEHVEYVAFYRAKRNEAQQINRSSVYNVCFDHVTLTVGEMTTIMEFLGFMRHTKGK